jgi:hypothetical protein
MSGGAGGGRGGGDPAVTSGSAKKTRLRCFEAELFVRQDCWRETDNGWRTTDVLAAAGGRPAGGPCAAVRRPAHSLECGKASEDV